MIWKTEAVDVGREGTYQVQGVATVFLRQHNPLSGIKVDPHTVSWDWTDPQGKVDRAHEGAVVPVKGTLVINKLRAFPALSFSLYLVAAKP